MPSVRIIGFLLLLLTVGCAQRETQQAGTTQSGAAAVEPPPAAQPSGTAAVKPEVRPEKPPVSGSPGQGLTATEAPAVSAGAPPPGTEAQKQKAAVSAPRTEAPGARTDASAPKADGLVAKTPAKAPASSAPAEKGAQKESTAPAPVKPPPLDLASLEKRLKETNAIGVFTKLTLKNQVDDLLGRFRAYYEGRAKIALAELRQPYDLLILKVLALLQDGDPALARAIVDSREAIWGILADPARFKALSVAGGTT